MKAFITKLKATLRFKEISSLLIYIAPSILLILLSNLYPLLLILYILYLIYLYKRNKVLFKYSLILSLFILLIYYLNYLIIYYYSDQESYTGIISSINDNNFIINSGIFKIKIYTDDFRNIIIGNKITLSIDHFEISERSLQNTFSYYRYKLSKRIIKEGYLDTIYSNSESFSIYVLKKYIIEYIDKYYDIESSLYLKRMILGINEFDSSLDDSINSLGIIFLFCISGLHISLLSVMIKKIFRIFNIEEEVISLILIVILLLYLLIVNNSSSINRATIIVIIKETTSIKKTKLTSLDSLTISFIILLIINPFYIFEVGFYLSFITTSIIYLSHEKKLLKSQFIITIFSLPLILYNSNEVNILVLFFSLVFNILFSEIIIPLTYLTFLIYPLNFIYKYVILILNNSIIILSKINLNFEYSITSIYTLLIIYFFLIYIFRYISEFKKMIKGVLIILSTILIEFIICRIPLSPTIEMLDCGQGDSFLIRDSKYNILIDTGEADDYNTTINYLKSLNINKLDCIFISHTDSDHYGNIENILSNIKVDKVVMNETNTKYTFKNSTFYTIRYDSDDINNQSMMLYVTILNKRILFTGDIEEETEIKYLADYNLKVDILKVAHHGSSSSSTISFLESINPKISLISVGLNNSYGHPSSEVIERLKSINTTIYRTDIDGSVKIYLFYNFYIFKTYNKQDILILQNLKNIKLII